MNVNVTCTNVCIFKTFTSLLGYRPAFKCSASGAFENETFTRNNSYYVTYDKCHMKVFYNDSSQNEIKLVKDSTCTEGYQYSLDKYSTYVTEVFYQFI